MSATGEFVSATILWRDVATIVLDDVDAVQKLATFFPDVGHETQTDREAGYYPRFRIKFHRDDGAIVEAIVNSRLTMWNAGRGEQFNLKPGLREFLETFRKL
jgi:hypothetical protein